MVGMATPPKKRKGPPPDPNSKRSLGVPRNINPRKAFHAPAELFAALEAYIASKRPQPTESECLRTALEKFLEAEGFWPQAK